MYSLHYYRRHVTHGTSDFELMGNCLLQDVIQSDQSVSMKTQPQRYTSMHLQYLCIQIHRSAFDLSTLSSPRYSSLFRV